MYTNLKDTVALMNSSDYKERFIAEYWQTKIRYNKLHQMLVKYDAGKLDFTPTCPIEVLKEQKQYMGMYLNKLEVRAVIEDIELNTVCNKDDIVADKITNTIKNSSLDTLTVTSYNQAKEIQKKLKEIGKQDSYAERQLLVRQMMDYFYDGQTLYNRHGNKYVIKNLIYRLPDNGNDLIRLSGTWENGAFTVLDTDRNFDLIYELWDNTKNH